MIVLEKDLPQLALEKCNDFYTDKYSKIVNIGFILNSLSANQKAYSVITSINKYLKNNSFVEFSLFNHSKELPILIPHTAVYSIVEANQFDGYLVACDVQSLIMAKPLLNKAKLIYYVYDLVELLNIDAQFFQFLKENNIPVISRTKNHQIYLKKRFNIDSHHIYVYDFDLENVVEIVKGFISDKNRIIKTQKR